MADQIATASKKRLLRKIDAISCDQMKAVEEAMRVQLSLG
jgi:mRNA-degrading endonuclease toxin of MazEF toxin-antitoxin module